MCTPAFCRSLPKVELHAHLSGSVSLSSLQELSTSKSIDFSNFTKNRKNLHYVFDSYFPLVHSFIRRHDDLYALTRRVLTEFGEDNVVYLELRTTPKKLEENGDNEQYVQTVCQAIDDHNNLSLLPLTRLLLSIDRGKHDVKEALSIIQLAQKLKSKGEPIVGIDVCGDPRKGNLVDLEPILNLARNKFHLPISLHMAEIVIYEENQFALDRIKPERIGHGLTLHPRLGGHEQLWDRLRRGNGVVEVCISSNAISESISDVDQSHVIELEQENLPYVICTDDKGLFDTSLSNEFVLAANCLKWSRRKAFERAKRAIEFAFCSEGDKEFIRRYFRKFEKINDVSEE